MKRQFLSILAGTSLFLGLGLAASISGIESLEQEAVAQTPVQHNSTTDGFQGSEGDSLFGESGDLNPFDLIHNANFNSGRTMGQFRQDTQRQLNRASQDFRRQQLELMRQQQQVKVGPASPLVDR